MEVNDSFHQTWSWKPPFGEGGGGFDFHQHWKPPRTSMDATFPSMEVVPR